MNGRAVIIGTAARREGTRAAMELLRARIPKFTGAVILLLDDTATNVEICSSYDRQEVTTELVRASLAALTRAELQHPQGEGKPLIVLPGS